MCTEQPERLIQNHNRRFVCKLKNHCMARSMQGKWYEMFDSFMVRQILQEVSITIVFMVYSLPRCYFLCLLQEQAWLISTGWLNILHTPVNREYRIIDLILRKNLLSPHHMHWILTTVHKTLNQRLKLILWEYRGPLKEHKERNSR
jgi:hypothetical protein